MKAFFQPAAGAQPVVGTLPVPPVTPGHVLVRVRAAGLGGTDAGIAAGLVAAYVPHPYPLTLGRDASWVVEAVGAGVTPGDDVVGHVPVVPLGPDGYGAWPGTWRRRRAARTCPLGFRAMPSALSRLATLVYTPGLAVEVWTPRSPVDCARRVAGLRGGPGPALYAPTRSWSIRGRLVDGDSVLL